ncbi:MAG: glycerol-3-phosphate 1-O-acyltransferase PlsY [Clostridiaceae bacterium]|nr:glycerol-3-phosphate 1-O-acyltransferase PlsY [Clostridiaceae bacterium]
MVKIVFALLGAYLLGSVSGAIVAARLFHDVDIRKFGSGNAGLTNTLRTLGPGTAAAVLAIDAAKTVLALWLGQYLAGEIGLLCAAVGAALGHAFPLYYRFKGGKCVLSTAMICAFFDWRALLLLAVLFVWVVFLSRKVSVGSLTVAVLLPFVLWALGAGQGRVVVGGLLTLMIVILHRGNIRRLVKGEEPPTTF